MSKNKEGISEDYKLEVEQALEEVIERPVGSDSLEAKVLPVEVPDSVEQFLDYVEHTSRTEYCPEVKVYESSTSSESTDYWYHAGEPEAVTDSQDTASYLVTVNESSALENAESQIASAALYNTFGTQDALTHVNESTQARIDIFKLLNPAQWIMMYDASAWLINHI